MFATRYLGRMSMRKSVRKRFVKMVRYGAAYILRITYKNGHKTWAVSEPGGLTLFGSDRAWMNRYIRVMQ